MALKQVKQMTNISWGTVGSVMVGIMALGAVYYAVRKLPDNSITAPVKKTVSEIS